MDSAIQSDKCPPKQVFVLLINIFMFSWLFIFLNMLIHTEIHNMVFKIRLSY